jgi:4-hydroxybenzoate polyprenyltransferase
VPKIYLKLLDHIFLLRIPLLAPVWTILLLGWITGNPQSTIGGSFILNANPLNHSLWLIIFGFSLNVVSIYVVNQIVDVESDRINNKLFILPNGFVSIPAAWFIAVVCATSGMLIAIHFGKTITILFILSLLLGIFYNLPPANLKNRAIGGVVANALGHGMLTYLVGWYLVNSSTPISADLIMKSILASLSATFANGAVYLATTVPDAEGDRCTGKQTFCVKYGARNTAVLAAILCLLSLLSAYFISYNSWVMILPAALSTFFFIKFAISNEQKSAFKAFKWPVFLLTIFVTIFIPEYAVLIIATFIFSRIYYKKRFNLEYPTFKAQ